MNPHSDAEARRRRASFVIVATGASMGRVLWGAGLGATKAECRDVLKRNRKVFYAMVPGCSVRVVQEPNK